MKKPRSNLLLPTTPDRHSLIEQLDELTNWLWHSADEWPTPQPFDLLRIYVSLMSDSAMPPNVAREVLSRSLKPDGLRAIAAEIPSERGKVDRRRTKLGLGARTKLAVYCATARRAVSRDLNAKVRARLANDSDVTKEINRQLELARTAAKAKWTLTMADIAELAPYIGLREGAEAYHFTVLAGRSRPASQHTDDPYQINGVSQEMISHLFHGDGGICVNLRRVRSGDNRQEDATPEPPPEWIAESKDILRSLCAELDNEVSRRCNTAKKAETARRIFADARRRIPDYYPQSCVTRLAVDFAEERFVCDQTVIARTIRDYLSRCIINGLLTFEEAFSLADWDPDDFVDAVEERINSSRLTDKTKGLVLVAYNQFLRFACPRLKIPTVSLKDLKQNFIGGAGQWRLLSPHVIDRLLRQLASSGGQLERQIAVTIALAYYGGLRASEIRRLCLSNIVVDERLGVFEIELLRGKTPNARRRVPMHALASSVALALIEEVSGERKEQFSSSTPLCKIVFLGIPGEVEGFQYHSLSSAARTILKAAFGESANIHLLRHSFCSNLFVRWYSLRHPSVLDNHRDRSHEIYQCDLQSQLNNVFENMPGQEGDVRPSDLVVMIKITGHASPMTMFLYYIHSYTLIHEHTVRRIADSYFDDTFKDLELKHLVPGMRSSASRAKLASKTIRGLCERLSVDGWFEQEATV